MRENGGLGDIIACPFENAQQKTTPSPTRSESDALKNRSSHIDRETHRALMDYCGSPQPSPVTHFTLGAIAHEMSYGTASSVPHPLGFTSSQQSPLPYINAVQAPGLPETGKKTLSLKSNLLTHCCGLCIK